MLGDSRPTGTPSSPSAPEAVTPLDAVARFDAGDRGCGDGLAQEFRRQMDAVAVGERLRVTVRDPSAKADIPSVARMLGHRVVSEEPLADGRLVITVERGHVRKADL